MRPNKSYFLLLSFLAFHLNCTTQKIQSPYSDRSIQLEGWEKVCKSERVFPQWYLFWGAYPIREWKEQEFFPDSKRSYRISIKTTWLDGVVSALGGLTISITRKTWVIEDCVIDGPEETK
ncbi:hypothetical protein [Leptospira ryugenii]|uniref:hypothetical protein n=1 Tax=Leptospira ryugenii TaxID=1917863 RepID=UPI000D5A0436|nr:hypothetical protein [Leptospira ryugenii]